MKLFLATILTISSLHIGNQPPERVLGYNSEDNMWYPGEVTSRNGTKVTMLLDNGMTISADTSGVFPMNWDIGERVECNLEGKGSYFWGMISKMMPDETFWIVYDEGNLERTSAKFCRCQR